MLLACSCFLSVSLVSANADEVDHSAYHIYTTVSIYGGSTLTTGMIYPKDSTRQNIAMSKAITGTSNLKIGVEHYLANSDKTALYDKGAIVQGKLENIYFKGSVNYPNVATYTLQLKTASAYVLYADNTTKSVPCDISKDRNGYYVVDFNFEAEKDVSQIVFNMVTDTASSLIDGKSITVNIEVGEPTTAAEANDNIVFNNLYSDVQSAEVGWLARIWQKLSNGFDSLIDGIVNLPAKIWGFIEDGLKSLFVPDEAFIASYKDKWEQLLSDKLGAVWQVVEVTFGSWEEINVSDEQNTIAIPKVSIPLPEDNEFSFGPYDVKIVPDGFEFLATAVKAITGILSTFLFINGVRKRYDEVMGVEQ